MAACQRWLRCEGTQVGAATGMSKSAVIVFQLLLTVAPLHCCGASAMNWTRLDTHLWCDDATSPGDAAESSSSDDCARQCEDMSAKGCIAFTFVPTSITSASSDCNVDEAFFGRCFLWSSRCTFSTSGTKQDRECWDNYVLKKSAADVKSALCTSFTCPSGHRQRSNASSLRCGSTTCSSADAELCCGDEVPCMDFKCSAGFALKTNASSQSCTTSPCTDADESVCCEATTTSTTTSTSSTLAVSATCATLDCGQGWTLRENASAIRCGNVTCSIGADRTSCCKEAPLEGKPHTCSTLSCPVGMSPKPGTEDLACHAASSCSLEADKSRCCTPNAQCSSLTCPSGYVSNVQTATSPCAALTCSVSADLSACCQAANGCSKVQCPTGYRKRDNAAMLSCNHAECDPVKDVATCCLRQATCNTLSCPSGYVTRPGAETLLCQSDICNAGHDKSTCCVENNNPGVVSSSSALVGSSAAAASAAASLPCHDPGLTSLPCSSRGIDAPVAGVPQGSFTIILCPNLCLSSVVYGTGAYSPNSAVCTAAVHVGVISSGGGYIKLRITVGLPEYVSSLLNGIVSEDAGSANRSMVFSVPSADEICQGGYTSTTTDMPWGWPWWAWFALCSSILALPVVLALLLACIWGAQKSVKTKKRVDDDWEVLQAHIDDDPLDYGYIEDARHPVLGDALAPPLLHDYGDSSAWMAPDAQRRPPQNLALPAW